MTTLRLPTHSYRLRSTPASTARLVNVYAEQLPPDAKTPLILSRAPGIRDYVTAGAGPIRGMHTFNGDPYIVSGTTLYRGAIDGSLTVIGTIPGVGSVSMDHNVDYLVIVSEPDAYYTDGVTVTQITDADFTSRGAKYVRFLDNYMVFMEPDSGRIFWSDVGSVTSFDSLNFVTAEGAPDNNVGIESDHQQMIALGETSLQILQFTDNGLEPTINGFAELGCFNGDTVAKLDNSIFWVANNSTVVRLNGATPVRMSTHPIEQFLSTVDVSTLRAYSYDQDGHFFYVLCCSTGCFVFDAVTNEWHERATYPEDYYRWQYHCVAHGRQYVGDFFGNEVGYFSPTIYSDIGILQRCEWTYQPIYSENKTAVHHSIEIVLEVGVGLTLNQGSDPELMLAYSNDGGKTWVNLPNKKIGKMGEYRTRVRWFGLGSAPQRVYRAAVSDPIPVNVVDTVVEVTGGRL